MAKRVSGATSLTAGYATLQLLIDLSGPERLPADSLRRLTVGVSNFSGEPVAAAVKLAIQPLRMPRRLIRERLWDAPDVFVLPESVFLDSFPHDEYRQETKKETWARDAVVWEATAGAVGGQARYEIPAGRLMPGWYVITATTTDRYGQEASDLQYVELFDGKTGMPGSPDYNWNGIFDETTVEPGGKAVVETGSSAADVYVIRKVRRGEDRSGGAFDYFTLTNNKNTTQWAVTEADRGGFGMTDIFVKDNRIYKHPSTISVPWTNKELTIHYATYRDKTDPGSQERWAVNISGSKGERVSAEVLAGMYDASLDLFQPYSWMVPFLYPVFRSIDGWEENNNFVTERATSLSDRFTHDESTVCKIPTY